MPIKQFDEDSDTLASFREELRGMFDTAQKSSIALGGKLLEARSKLKGGKSFGKLLESLPANKSTIYKLIKIAQSDRIRSHRKELARITAWSTLYEIIQLPEPLFERFREEYLSGDSPKYFKRSDVQAMRYGSQEPTDPNVGSIFAEIRVETDKLDSPEELETLREKLERLVDLPHTNIRFTDLMERFEAAFERQVQREVLAEYEGALDEARKRLREVYREEMERCWQPILGKTKKQCFYERWGLSAEEIFHEDEHPNTMLRRFGREPVRTDILGPPPE